MRLARLHPLLILALTACAPKAHARLPNVHDVAHDARDARPAVVRRAVRAFEAETGVELRVYGLPGDGVPPALGSAQESPVDLALVPRALPVVAGALGIYPRDVRVRLVPRLWIVGKLRANGHPFLGMAHPRHGRLDLAIRPRTRPGPLEGTVHHELAHMLMRQPGFDAPTWRAFSGGRYVGMEPDRKWSGEGRPWERAGFVTAYASKNPGEDFATLAELGFTRPERLRAMARDNPLLLRKVAFVTEAYRRLLPGTELPWVDGATREAPSRPPRR